MPERRPPQPVTAGQMFAIIWLPVLLIWLISGMVKQADDAHNAAAESHERLRALEQQMNVTDPDNSN